MANLTIADLEFSSRALLSDDVLAYCDKDGNTTNKITYSSLSAKIFNDLETKINTIVEQKLQNYEETVFKRRRFGIGIQNEVALKKKESFTLPYDAFVKISAIGSTAAAGQGDIYLNDKELDIGLQERFDSGIYGLYCKKGEVIKYTTSSTLKPDSITLTYHSLTNLV